MYDFDIGVMGKSGMGELQADMAVLQLISRINEI